MYANFDPKQTWTRRFEYARRSALIIGLLVTAANLTATVNATLSTFTNAATITIPSVGPGTPYPSTINVGGLAGTITQVTVGLTGLAHTYPNDVDVLLVGPTGQKVIVMSDVGGGNPVSGVNLTLSDGAAASLPLSTTLVSGTFKPTDYTTADGADTFPAPAPAGPYGAVLSAFNGTAANGVWSLYVVDDGAGDLGSFAGGWSLTITTSGNGSAPPAISDIADQWTMMNTPTAAIPFTVTDADTPVNNLTLSASSSNPTLVPINNIVFGGQRIEPNRDDDARVQSSRALRQSRSRSATGPTSPATHLC